MNNIFINAIIIHMKAKILDGKSLAISRAEEEIKDESVSELVSKLAILFLT